MITLSPGGQFHRAFVLWDSRLISPPHLTKRFGFSSTGSIQIADGPLKNANGSAGKAIVEALSEKYQSNGEEFLQELSGSFRLALWDGKHQKLIVAVDPFATRPLYFLRSDRELFFAPRISYFSAIADASRKIDPNVLLFYLNHSFIPAPRTVFRDVSRLEPGCYLHWQGGRLGVHQYWDIRYEEDSSLTEKNASELIRSEVERVAPIVC